MTEKPNRSGNPDQTLAERLAPLSIAEIEAMSDPEIAELMDATPDELAAEPAWTWHEAAKIATDEFVDRLADDVGSGRAEVITDPTEIQRRLGGRPRVGGDQGKGPSTQVRVRVSSHTRSALETIAASQGRRISDVSRDALDEYIASHGK